MILNALVEKLKRRSKDDFKGRHFEATLILQAVSWYLRYPLSYRDIEELFRERGLEVDHSTLNRWVLAYAPLIEKRLRAFRKPHCGSIRVDEASGFVVAPETAQNPTYRKTIFLHKLAEMGFENRWSQRVMGTLGTHFSRAELEEATRRSEGDEESHEVVRTRECVRWLAESNYQVHFHPSVPLSQRVIFPVSPNESNGIEDARFVRFREEDGTICYYATYTAYNGRAILPQLIETTDFLNFRVLTLNGRAVQNKGMALFPRRIDGRFAMISRQDDENLHLMFSENLHFWNDPQLLQTPLQPWEAVKIGNCGSPIETPEGWLVITHGVGPMRRYCIGALLLDLADPGKVIGSLTAPLLEPQDEGREGYVPNVVYSCGAMVHAGRLVLPYALSDTSSTIATIDLASLLAELNAGFGPESS